MSVHITSNPALDAAYEDFDPSLVDIDTAKLTSLALPKGLQGISGTLDGELGSDPDIFIPYLTVMNTQNWRFWEVRSGEFVRYEHEGKQGALAMQAAFQTAWMAAMPQEPSMAPLGRSMTAVQALRERVAAGGLADIFGDIPAPKQRVELLLEVLNPDRLAPLAQAFKQSCTRDAALSWRQAAELSQAFPLGYADRYLKKAQLTMMFIAGQWMQATGTRISLDLTAAADYQLPKVLASLGLLFYSPELKATIDAGKPVKRNSREELAIRAATVLAVQQLCRHFGCLVEEADFWLWLNRNVDKKALFHRTVTTDY